MFESNKLDHQRMNSSSHHSHSNMKENTEWGGKWKYSHIRNILIDKKLSHEYLP